MVCFTKWMLAPALAMCFVLVGDTTTADAGGFYLSIGGNSCGGYGGRYVAARPYYGYRDHGYRSHYRSYVPSYHGRYYHDTSHFDYHPTEIRRHGNHYDVYPGHYDFHRSGHWHH